MSIEQLGKIRTESDLKTALNMTLVGTDDFNISSLKAYFDPDYFFIKLSPINENEVYCEDSMGTGIITQSNKI